MYWIIINIVKNDQFIALNNTTKFCLLICTIKYCDKKVALESSNRPLFPQWSHHVYPQFLPGSHPNHQQNPQVIIQQQNHQQHYHLQQQHHHMSNANNNNNNNYINVNASNDSQILHNNHIINNNHQHMHQSSINYGIIGGGGGAGNQMLSNNNDTTVFYQQQHQFMQHQRSGEDANALITNALNSSLGSHSADNGLSQHMKSRSNRLMKNNGLNNNFYRSSGICLYCIAICVCILNLFRFCA